MLPVSVRKQCSSSSSSSTASMLLSTKLYLTIVFSTLCILFFQYQLSAAGSQNAAAAGINEVVTHVDADDDNDVGDVRSQRRRTAVELAALIGAGGVDRVAVTTPSSTAATTSAIRNSSSSTPSTTTSTTTTTTTRPPFVPSTSAASRGHSNDTNNTIINTTTTTTTSAASAARTSTSSSPLSPAFRNGRAVVDNDTKPPLPPPLYIITPTYRRSEQVAEITRLGHTLKHVPNLFWLVIEDAAAPTAQVTRQLRHIGVPFVHLVAPMPARFAKQKVKPRGVSNRNRGLSWLRANATEGVFYFADDDNTYDLSIFEQMRYTRKVSMWPVGLVTKFGVSSPVVRDGKLTGFYDGWIGNRKYPVDMAGFAVGVEFFLRRPNATMPFKPGYEEDHFLRSLAPLEMAEIELLASNCTEVLTWHTQTKKNNPATQLDTKKYGDTNLVRLRQLIV